MRRPALALLLGCLLLVAGVSALDGYDYYQTIEYAGCDQEVYQQDIIIHRSAGTAYNETSGGLETWHIFVGEHCREDYGDVRFTDAAGAELAYYLWPDHTSSSARFTVRLENATAAWTLMVYYGNTTATTTSNGDGTYFLFDNFDEDTLNTTKWTSTGSISISGGILTISNAGKIQSTGTFGNKHTFMARAKVAPVSQNWVGWLNTPSGTFAIFQYTTSSRCHVYFTSDSNNAAPINFSGEFHTFEIRRGPSTIFLIDGGNSITIAQSSTAQIRATCEIYSGTQTMLLDWVAVRAYSATPPAALTFETAAPPVTAFTATPTAGLAPLTVQFTDTSTGSPTSWLWDFGDGNTSTAQNPQHTYTAPGLYTVTLTATNEYGSDTETKTDYITVYAPVTAQFMADVTYGALPLTVQFTDASSGSPTSWTWDFGDGNTSTDQNPEHTYTSTGTYTVKLIASHPYDSDEETKVNYITVVTLQPFPGCSSNPTDPDSDGLYEDINGNGRWDFQDLVLFFQHLTWCNANQPITLFDWNSNFRCDFDDVHKLWLDGGMI